jgi:pyruvate formate lyase activating enzyme
MLSNRVKRRRRVISMPVVRIGRPSLTDYPGELSVKLVIPGCNLRCPYCVKGDLIRWNDRPLLSEKDILQHIYRVKGYLTGVVFGGGEPTLHNGLLQFLYKVRSVGYKIRIDTNGTNPRRLNKLMEEKVIDYISLDVKAPFERYPEVVASKVNLDAVKQSVKLLRRGGVDYDFTTTAVPDLLDGDDLEEIAKVLVGSKRFVIKQHRPGRMLDKAYEKVNPFSAEELRGFQRRIAPYFAECIVKLI